MCFADPDKAKPDIAAEAVPNTAKENEEESADRTLEELTRDIRSVSAMRRAGAPRPAIEKCLPLFCDWTAYHDAADELWRWLGDDAASRAFLAQHLLSLSSKTLWSMFVADYEKARVAELLWRRHGPYAVAEEPMNIFEARARYAAGPAVGEAAPHVGQPRTIAKFLRTACIMAPRDDSDRQALQLVNFLALALPDSERHHLFVKLCTRRMSQGALLILGAGAKKETLVTCANLQCYTYEPRPLLFSLTSEPDEIRRKHSKYCVLRDPAKCPMGCSR